MTDLIPIDRGERPEPADIQRALEHIRTGELIGAPGDGTYVVLGGLSAACERLEDLSRKTGRAPFLVLPFPETAEDFLDELSPRCQRLLRRAWPGPIVCQVPRQQASLLEEAGTPGQRLWPNEFSVSVPAQTCLRALAEAAEYPLVAIEVEAEGQTSWESGSGQTLAKRQGLDLALIFDAGPPRYPEGVTWVRLERDRWTITRAGVAHQHTLARLSAEVILFVCTGNTCRSPMAEGLLRKYLAEQIGCRMEDLIEHGFDVLSAGVSAHPGSPASAETAELLHLEGIDMSSHASQPVTASLLLYADHVFTMTAGHRATLLGNFPDFQQKVRLLAPHSDIPDPYGGSWHDYRECRDQIVDSIQDLLARLLPGERPA